MTLPRSSPANHGVDPAGVGRFLDTLAENGIEMHSMMLLRHGHVLAEGWWTPYGPDRVHLLYSLSKSFTSTAIGLALDEGRLSVDDPVLSFFPESAPADPDPLLAAMRVRHLLCMGTGHYEDTLERVVSTSGSDLAGGFFGITPDQEPGTVFAYNNTATYLLSAIVTRLTGERLVDYLRPRLLGPLGIEHALWQSRDGVDVGFSGLHVTTESIARFGQLYLQRGRWGDRQLLPESWVAEATAHHIPTVSPYRTSEPPDWHQGYGYQFWMCRHGAYRADGAYGQFCVVLPELDAVLATTAAAGDMQAVLDAAWAHLLPAFDAPPAGAGPRTGADDGSLAARLAALRIEPVTGARRGLSDAPQVFRPVAIAGDGQKLYPPLGDITVTASDGGFRLGLGDLGYIVCGYDAWADDVIAVSNSGAATKSVPVSSSAAWAAGGNFVADLAFVETPHRLQLRCDPAAHSYSMRWNENPLGGGDLAVLAAPR